MHLLVFSKKGANGRVRIDCWWTSWTSAKNLWHWLINYRECATRILLRWNCFFFITIKYEKNGVRKPCIFFGKYGIYFLRRYQKCLHYPPSEFSTIVYPSMSLKDVALWNVLKRSKSKSQGYSWVGSQ